MASADDLRGILNRIDGRGYKAYRDIKGAFDFRPFALHVDHVQGDPFAAPSRLRVRVPMSSAGLPAALRETPVRRLALGDFLVRRFHAAIRRRGSERRGSGKSGLLSVDVGGQEILERSAAQLAPDWVEIRLEAGLPAAGRRILGRQAEAMLCGDLPAVVDASLRWKALPHDEARAFVECVENQEHLRAELTRRDLVAFVADGSVLPRESGASDRPLARKRAVPFESPESLRVELPLPNPLRGATAIRGMGISRGVTLIVGGGYHGKSTLLRALERGVYPHVPDDGREYVVSAPGLVKIRAEDGRRVEQVDIHAFISDLPQGRGTRAFCTDDASGSTSQAANIVEAVEAGATGLLLDEDTSATNFMVRDARMQALVHKQHEPITPFLDRVRELTESLGVSTVLAMGGSGDYFEAADRVVMMRDYRPVDVTAEAKRIAEGQGSGRRPEAEAPMAGIAARSPLAESFDASRGRREVKIDARGLHALAFGTADVDLRSLEQLVDVSQTRAVGHAIYLAASRMMDGRRSLARVLDELEAFFDERGLDELDPFHRRGRHPGRFARPRRFEIAAAINRLRSVRMRRSPGPS